MLYLGVFLKAYEMFGRHLTFASDGGFYFSEGIAR